MTLLSKLSKLSDFLSTKNQKYSPFTIYFTLKINIHILLFPNNVCLFYAYIKTSFNNFYHTHIKRKSINSNFKTINLFNLTIKTNNNAS